MENNKELFIVEVCEGTAYENNTYTKFVTDDKIKAEIWVNKFNRIIINHSERIKNIMSSDNYLNSGHEYSLYEYICFQSPQASFRKIEKR